MAKQEIVKLKTDIQELADYNCVCDAYSAMTSGFTILNKQEPKYASLDMWSSAITSGICTTVFPTEIKAISKKYKDFNVNTAKIDKIANVGRGYLAIINCDMLYLFDFKKVNWNELKTKVEEVNKVEFDPSKGTTKQLQYILPKNKATKVIQLCQPFINYQREATTTILKQRRMLQ